MSKHLPPNPNLENLKKQAKQLLKGYKTGDSDAITRIKEWNPGVYEAFREKTEQAAFTLRDAQHVIARELGFKNWKELSSAVQTKRSELASTTVDDFKKALNQGDIDNLRMLLNRHPELANARPWQPNWEGTALEGMASGCVWHRPEKHQTFKLLVEASANCDIQTAPRAGLLETVEGKLLSDTNLLNSTDARGRTALYRATCVYGKFEEGEAVADFLIAQGAEIEIYSACTLGLADRVHESLDENSQMANNRDPDGITALHWAVRPRRNRENAVDITETLLEREADTHAKNQQESEMMPLHHVGEWSGLPDQADLLVKFGADINAGADNGWTPLDYALDRGRGEMAQHLKKLGGKESGKRQ